MADATLKEIREYFGMSMADFRAEWVPLPDKDKAELKAGIGNGSLSY